MDGIVHTYEFLIGFRLPLENQRESELVWQIMRNSQLFHRKKNDEKSLQKSTSGFSSFLLAQCRNSEAFHLPSMTMEWNFNQTQTFLSWTKWKLFYIEIHRVTKTLFFYKTSSIPFAGGAKKKLAIEEKIFDEKFKSRDPTKVFCYLEHFKWLSSSWGSLRRLIRLFFGIFRVFSTTTK